MLQNYCKSNKSSEKFEVNTAFLHISEQIKSEIGGKTLETAVNSLVDKVKEVELFSDRLKCVEHSIGTMNHFIDLGASEKMVDIAERLQEVAIDRLGEMIHQRSGVKVILIAGPSSSGKTTFSKKLGRALAVRGYDPKQISLDDYFVSRTRTPRDENGEYDYESIYAEDIDLFQEQITQLLRGEEVELPRYDFPSGMSVKSGNHRQPPCPSHSARLQVPQRHSPGNHRPLAIRAPRRRQVDCPIPAERRCQLQQRLPIRARSPQGPCSSIII